MWSAATATRHSNCGLPPEFFFVTPASSLQHHQPEAATEASTTINFDPHSHSGSNAIGVGVGVIPILTATPFLAQPSIGGGGSGTHAGDEDNRSGFGMQLWQHQQVQNSSAYLKKHITNVNNASLLPTGGTGGGGGDSSSVGPTTCQDCGNQAKKDCSHRRCRTCCKNRGYDCTTHVKSTWVSAARRRERQLMAANIATAGSSQSTSSAKKQRLGGASQTTTTSHTSASNTPPRSFDTSSSHQDASFKESLPGQVRAPAVFKCVRVTALGDGDDEYAYQAVTSIGGHIFKGFLYHQGFEVRKGFPDISELHLGGIGASGGGGGEGGNVGVRNGASSSHPVIDTSDVYATSGGGLLAGSSYSNTIN